MAEAKNSANMASSEDSAPPPRTLTSISANRLYQAMGNPAWYAETTVFEAAAPGNELNLSARRRHVNDAIAMGDDVGFGQVTGRNRNQ